MKIKIDFNLWLWLCKFSYRKMKIAVEELPVGIPGMRDPDNRCPGYTPRKRIPGDAPADCQSDGHYLCVKCAFLDAQNFTEENPDDKKYLSSTQITP